MSNIWDSATNKDFFSMLFVEYINSTGILDKKYNWYDMTPEEKNKWRKFQENFKYPDWENK